MWINPNAWIHFTSDYIATNWVLPLDGNKCVVYASWILHEDVIEGEDYNVEHLIWYMEGCECRRCGHVRINDKRVKI